jgi:hypothetical protein
MWRKESFPSMSLRKLASELTTGFRGAVPYDNAVVFPGHLLCGSRRSKQCLVWTSHSLRRAAGSVRSRASSFQSLFHSFSAMAHSFQYLFRRGGQCLPFFLVAASLALSTARCMRLGALPVNKAFKTDAIATQLLRMASPFCAQKPLRYCAV